MSQNKTPDELLAPFRADIDALDSELIVLLSKRFSIVRDVGTFKTQNGIEIVQSQRVDDVLNRVAALAEDNDVPASIVRAFYASIIEEAHTIENGIKTTRENAR
jgi:chorismate mutase